ncbi:MAG: hypothetical protein ACREVB_07245, partial [Burkholderiales bacterium]
ITAPIDAASGFETDFNMDLPFPWDCDVSCVAPRILLPPRWLDQLKICCSNQNSEPMNRLVRKRNDSYAGVCIEWQVLERREFW